MVRLTILYKIIKDLLNIMKLGTYSAVKMHPNAKKIAPMHIFIEFSLDISLFLKNEKKIKNGIREPKIKIKIK